MTAKHTRALLIVRHGKIVFEWYADGVTAATRQGSASLAKAMVGGTSLLLAMADGRISPEDKAAKYIPSWRSDPAKSAITINGRR